MASSRASSTSCRRVEWDEREAHDLVGVRFAGHAPLRPLVAHPAATADWATPVAGEDVHQVAVGPIHAGIIESGHFRFHVVGERILHLDLRLFYKHRGLEQAAIGGTPEAALALAQRACAACAVTNSVAVAQAYEMSSAARPTPRCAAHARCSWSSSGSTTISMTSAPLCAGIGFAPGRWPLRGSKSARSASTATLQATGSCSGRSRSGRAPFRSTRPRPVRRGRRSPRSAADAAALWHQIRTNGSVRDRLVGVGVLGPDAAAPPRDRAARRPGHRGSRTTPAPTVRSSGTADLRSPGSTTRPVMSPHAPRSAPGSSLAVARMLDELLSMPIIPGKITLDGPRCDHWCRRRREPARPNGGHTRHHAGVVSRLHLRTGSLRQLAVAGGGHDRCDPPRLSADQ